MKRIKVGDIIIYEGRECLVTKLTDSEAKLTNLKPKNDKDWTEMKVLVTDIKEDTGHE